MTVIPKPRNDSTQPIINERIRYEKVQLINHEGTNEGIVTREYALRAARESGLDLVIIAEQGREGVPVCKLADHGKLIYAKKKQASDAKKKQHVIQVKELKLRPKIGEHDFQTKMNQAASFLREGKRVKFTLVFRGRENTMKHEQGTSFFEKIHNALYATDLAPNLIQEKDLQADTMWSRVYYLKK